jgi:LPXTG-motif cell wall-anchored protein
MFRRLAALVAVATAALFVSAASASANYTPDTQPGVTSISVVRANGDVIFQYNRGGYIPGKTVTITVTVPGKNVGGGPGARGLLMAPRTAVVGSVKADAKGNFRTTVTLTTPGLNTLTASGPARNGGMLNVVTQVRVLAAGSAAGTGAAALPRTGSDLGTQLWIAGGLLAAGGSLVLLSVARRRHAHVQA